MLVLAGIGLTACNNNSGSAIIDFIPGTYVNQAQSRYSVANDTLIITAVKSNNNIYQITRKTGYRRITDAKPQPLQHQIKHWSGTWDQQKQILELWQTHAFYIFQPDKNSLLNGVSEYRKL